MSEWQELPLSEVVELVGGGTPKTTVSEYWDGDIPWLSVVDFNTGRKYVTDTEKKITKAGLENSSTKLLNAGDIILSARGTVGAMAVLSRPMTFNQSCYGLRGVANKSETSFIYYLVKDAVEGLQQISHGGVFDTITRDTFKDITLPIPPLEEQKAIASVLSSLDNKIDLLHRQNTILERMAETLFRQWFVEEAQDSDIGQFIDLQNGYAFKSQDFKDIGEQRVLKIKNISGGIIDVNNTDFIDRVVANRTDAKFKVVTGDILFAMTGAEIGKLGIVPKTNTPLWLNQRVGLLKEKFTGARFLAYLQLNSEIGQDYIENSATGSAQPNISGSLIEQCPFPKVEVSVIKECSEILDVYYQKLISNLGQIQTLEKLRDNLLPKLMSGEVRVGH